MILYNHQLEKTGKFEIDNRVKQLEYENKKLAITNETLENTIKSACKERAPFSKIDETKHRFLVIQLN